MSKLEQVNKTIERHLFRARTPHGKSRIEEVSIHTNGYSEPGYSGDIIALGNWNSITEYSTVTGKWVDRDTSPSKLGEALEKLGVELEWSDEWAICTDCGGLVRTSANSYSWKPSYHVLDSDIVCKKCVEKDPTQYLDDIEGNPNKCITFDIDLEEHGFQKVDQEFAHGFYGGQNADPKVIDKNLRELGVTRFIFKLDEVGQFDQHFSLWVYESEYDLVADKHIKSAGTDPAELLKRALQNAPIRSSEPGKVAVTNIDLTTGEVVTKQLTPEEFVRGKSAE